MNPLEIINLEEISPEEIELLCQRELGEDIGARVSEIIAEVQNEGDAALLRFAREFDGVELADLRATKTDKLDPQVASALDLLLENIHRHHASQMHNLDWEQSAGGITTGERVLPLDSVALYVPGGKGRFPSVMAMLGVPARLAGVDKIVVVTPPGPGGIDSATLYVARALGIEEIYAVGGAGAIAALALGNTSLPRVAKVVGPGNAYVTEAKRQLSHLLDPGPLAGPSESLVLADESADPVSVAREMLVEAEHGPDSRVLLLSNSSPLAVEVSRVLPDLVDLLPEPRRDYARAVFGRTSIIYHQDTERLVELANIFAPEHMRIITKQDREIYQQIRNAGEVLLGPWSSIALGNYSAGVNSVLPTAAAARSVSCLGVADFCKRNSLVQIDKEGARALAPAAAVLADYEGFPAHARAARDLEG